MEGDAKNSSNSGDKFRERFLALQKRRQESCHRSEARRVNDLKLSLLANIKQQLQSSDELEELQKCSIDLDAMTAEAEAEKERNKRHRRKKPSSEPVINSTAKLPKLDINRSSNTDTNSCNNSTTVSEHSEIAESMSKIMTVTSLREKSEDLFTSSSQGTTCSDIDFTGNSSTSLECSERLTDKTVDIQSNNMDSNKTPQFHGKQGSSKATVSTVDSDAEMKWSELKPYLTINDHLVRTTGSGRKPRSHLEERLEKAIESNDINTAEHLSDRLAEREFGIRIATAIDAKAYLDKQNAEKAAREIAKKKKLAWGFVPKHRWETKGNM